MPTLTGSELTFSNILTRVTKEHREYDIKWVRLSDDELAVVVPALALLGAIMRHPMTHPDEEQWVNEYGDALVWIDQTPAIQMPRLLAFLARKDKTEEK